MIFLDKCMQQIKYLYSNISQISKPYYLLYEVYIYIYIYIYVCVCYSQTVKPVVSLHETTDFTV